MRSRPAVYLVLLCLLPACGAAGGGDGSGYARQSSSSPESDGSQYRVAPEGPPEAGAPDQQGAGGTSGDKGTAGTGASAPWAPDAGAPAPSPPGGEEDAGTPDTDPPPPTGCAYPGGPYGAVQSSTVSPSLAWSAYPPSATTVSPLTPAEFLDCDGTRGVNALVIVYGAGWCSACADEAGALPQRMVQWAPAGVQVLYLLWQDPSGWPADTSFAQQWRDYFQLNGLWVAADPDFLLDSPAADALPYKMIVDPRTMRIVSTYSGDDGDDGILQLAYANQ